MAGSFEISGKDSWGRTEFEVYDEDGQRIDPNKDGVAWIEATREARASIGEDNGGFLEFMMQNGRDVENLYGPFEGDRA